MTGSIQTKQEQHTPQLSPAYLENHSRIHLLIIGGLCALGIIGVFIFQNILDKANDTSLDIIQVHELSLMPISMFGATCIIILLEMLMRFGHYVPSVNAIIWIFFLAAGAWIGVAFGVTKPILAEHYIAQGYEECHTMDRYSSVRTATQSPQKQTSAWVRKGMCPAS